MRKIKGLTLTFDLTTSTYTAAAGVAVPPLVWAVVYVPEGFPPTALKLSTAAFGNEDPKLGDPQPNTDPRVSLFEPNQNVMGSGVLDLNFQQSQIYRIRSSRLLNSGDSIFLLLMNAGLAVNGAAAPSLVLQGSILCSYAIGI
jgi:hypothetical protein